MSPGQEIPREIQVPAGARLVLRAHASGVQIYVCQQSTDGKAVWTLKGPEATLSDDRGEAIGKHYFGPAWKHNDGSEVTAKVTSRVNAPSPGSIPWLLLKVTARGGNGLLSTVTAIQRVATLGGLPPEGPCDASLLGAESRSEYEAEYLFYASD